MDTPTPSNFLRAIIEDDLKNGKNEGRVFTRFPRTQRISAYRPRQVHLPQFWAGLGLRGRCHLRFDDTNPGKEDLVYVASIKEDVRWLGFDWGEHSLSRLGLF